MSITLVNSLRTPSQFSPLYSYCRFPVDIRQTGTFAGIGSYLDFAANNSWPFTKSSRRTGLRRTLFAKLFFESWRTSSSRIVRHSAAKCARTPVYSSESSVGVHPKNMANCRRTVVEFRSSREFAIFRGEQLFADPDQMTNTIT